MQDRKLPAKKAQSDARNQLMMGFSLSIIIAACLVAILSAVTGLMLGHYFESAIWWVVLGFFVWSTGSMFVTIPLTMRFLKRYRSDKNFALVDAEHSRALKLLSAMPVRRRADVAILTSNLGLMRLANGHFEEAEALFRESVAYLEKNPRLINSMTGVVAFSNLAVSCIRTNKLVEAELHASRALEIAESPKVRQYPIMMGPPNACIGSVRLLLGETSSAYEHYKRALELYENEKVPAIMSSNTFDHARLLAYLGLAISTFRLGNIPESEQWCERTFALWNSSTASNSTFALHPMTMLANEYMNSQMFERAERLLNLAYTLGMRNNMHPDAKQVLNYYEKLLLLTNRPEEIGDMRLWLRHVDQPLVAS